MLFQASVQPVFQSLMDWGFVDAFLPFLIIFGILYAVLTQAGPFSNIPNANRINSILSFAIAALVVIPHITRSYPAGADPIVMINNILPTSAVLLFVIFLVLMLVGLVGGKVPNIVVYSVAFVSLLVLIFVIMGASIPGIGGVLTPLSDPNIQALLIALLIMGLVIYFITRTDQPDPNKPALKGVQDFFEALFGKSS